MSTKGERYFGAPLPPRESTTPGIGITRIATSTTAASLDMSAFPHFFGKRLVLMNESTTAGDAIFVKFAPTADTAVSAAQAGGTTLANSTVAANGFKLLPGETLVVVLNKAEHKFIHFDALANTPVLCIYPAGRGESHV